MSIYEGVRAGDPSLRVAEAAIKATAESVLDLTQRWHPEDEEAAMQRAAQIIADALVKSVADMGLDIPDATARI